MSKTPLKCIPCGAANSPIDKLCVGCGEPLFPRPDSEIPANKVFFRHSGLISPMSVGEGIGCLSVAALFALILCFFLVQCSNDRQAAALAQQQQEATDKAQKAKDDAKNRRKGFYCLSIIDGSEPDVVNMVKARLTDPDSFEHIETRITPVGSDGWHNLIMTYRSRNGFGGMVEGRVLARVSNRDCATWITAMENRPF